MDFFFSCNIFLLQLPETSVLNHHCVDFLLRLGLIVVWCSNSNIHQAWKGHIDVREENYGNSAQHGACMQAGFLHFSKILDIGLDINAWHCTHTENTFALTRSSSIWKSVAMSEALRLSQDKRCESWITDEDLCDAVAFVGPERQRVPFLRAPLATLSKPLKVALYGDWVVSSNVSLFHSFPIRFWGLWPLF